MTQLDLFAAMRAPAIRQRVNPDGPVVKGEVDETLRLPEPRMAWDTARIELHRHRGCNLWMWSTSYNTSAGGGGYRVGEKWGNFASTRNDALFYAVAELRERVASCDECKAIGRIRAWLNGLAPL